eukprot:2117310-Prymnesium_polylepis.1
MRSAILPRALLLPKPATPEGHIHRPLATMCTRGSCRHTASVMSLYCAEYPDMSYSSLPTSRRRRPKGAAWPIAARTRPHSLVAASPLANSSNRSASCAWRRDSCPPSGYAAPIE